MLGRAKSCHDLLLAVDRLDALNVLIIGCGGIGSLTAVNLAGAGIPH